MCNKSYQKAYKYLKNYYNIHFPDADHFDIIEETQEFDNGLLLIAYYDKEGQEEAGHTCVDAESFENIPDKPNSEKARIYLENVYKNNFQTTFDLIPKPTYYNITGDELFVYIDKEHEEEYKYHTVDINAFEGV